MQLDAASTLNLTGLGFITAVGSAGSDVIRAGAANQTLTGGGGGDTLIGYAGYGDTFRDTAANLNNSTIQNFGGSDVIDLTDLLPGAALLAFNAGTLTVSDGSHSAAMTLLGMFNPLNFHLAADMHGGTNVTYG